MMYIRGEIIISISHRGITTGSPVVATGGTIMGSISLL